MRQDRPPEGTVVATDPRLSASIATRALSFVACLDPDGATTVRLMA